MTAASLTDPALEKALTEIALSALDRALGNAVVFGQPKALEQVFPLPSRHSRRAEGSVNLALSRLATLGQGRASQFQRRILADALMRSGWINRMYQRLDLLLRRAAQPPAVLDPARRAIAASVWSGPDFCRTVSLRLYRRLRGEVLMSASSAAIPTLSAEFWWVLIATFADSSPLGAALRSAGTASSEEKSWAGFWEQYLLLRAKRSGRELPGRASALPLITLEAGALRPPDSDVQDTDAVRQGWRKSCPDWAGSLIAGAL